MIFSEKMKGSHFFILCLLTALLAAACSQSDKSEVSIAQLPMTVPTPAQAVEYGASLDEWEAATQTENNDNMTVVETIGSGGYPGPGQDLPQAAPPAFPETGYPGPDSSTAAVEEEVGDVALEELDTTTLFTLNEIIYQEIMWDALVPPDFTAEAIMAKYNDQLAQISDGSSEAADLYAQMQAEFDNAPVNETIDGELIRLPGFIAPLEYTDELITEFLLVPYFGACIHVPPPPANQTVLVKLSEGQGIKFEDAYYPFWVMGQLTAEGATTDLAEAGYYIENALIEPYSDGS